MTEHIFNNRSAAGRDEEGEGDRTPLLADERLWRAWRYVSDEMGEGERSEFEQLLGESQDLREAVAEAVELTQLVAVAEAEPVSLPQPAARRAAQSAAPPVWMRRLTWMVSGAAASLLVVVGLRLVPALLAPSTTQEPIVTGTQVELALAWSETRARMLERDADEEAMRPASEDLLLSASSLSASSLSASSLAAAEHESAESTMLSPLLLADPTTGVTTPDWMMAALRAEAGDEEATVPEEGEEI